MMNYLKRGLHATAVVLSLAQFSFASNNVNRYFPLLERPSTYVQSKGSSLTGSALYMLGSTADKRGGGKVGIPELWGKYDLRDVIESYLTVNPAANNPAQVVMGNNAWVNQNLPFSVSGRIEGVGLLLNGQLETGLRGLWLGAQLPIMSIRSSTRFNLNLQTSPENTILADRIRRYTHEQLGFKLNQVTKSGLGDLDAHMRFQAMFDHVLLMRTINLAFQTGVLAPTGISRDVQVPAAVPVGSDGHWGMYVDFAPAFELKQDITVGALLGLTHLFSRTKNVRLPVNKEPAIFSALVAKTYTEPGFTLKLSPYLTLGNLSDGLDFQVRYTYLRHAMDTQIDVRDDKTVPSYLQRDADLIARTKDLSKWRAHYMTFSLSYDTAVAMEKIKFAPCLFISYDMPMNSNAFTKTHVVQLGLELHF
ncbi:hypothetical protein EBZ39_06735 [bacterium]|nr:hypothetical protein [bacterium]